MYTKKIYSARDMALWTRYETFLFLVIGVIFVSLYEAIGFDKLRIPWTPLALIGTAVAFVIGFQNNSAYGRIWEARKIWGGIVNSSRTFGIFIKDMVTNEHAAVKMSDSEIQNEVKTFIYRHIAWMTALRYAMREPRRWETVIKEKTNKEWLDIVHPPEWDSKLEDELKNYLSPEEIIYVMDKSNKQTAVLNLQSSHLRKLKESGHIWEFSFLELENVMKELFSLQGKSERIKNFPYPRHFASLNHHFMWVFVLLLPLGIMPQFEVIGHEIRESFPILGEYFVWVSVPFYAAVAWVFHTLERIGRTGENPFEGSANDVPISTISRGIEIDLRQNLGENKEDIPEQFPLMEFTQM